MIRFSKTCSKFAYRSYFQSCLMLKFLFRFLTAVVISALAVSMPGCRHDNKLYIGISQCSDDDWRNKMNREILRELMFHPNVEVEIRSADDDSHKQIRDIRYFVDHKVDILIVAPNEAEALTPIIKETYEKGIPVVVFDRDINGDYFTAFQGANNADIGAHAASFVLSQIARNPRILEVYGLDGSTPAMGRHEGFYNTLKEHADTVQITTVYGNWNYEDAYKAVTDVLTKDSAFDIIYAHNDRMALAAREVADKIGIKPLIIGIDAAPEIGMKAVAEGKIDASFLYPTEGVKLINTALAILNDEPYERITMIPSSSVVTADNVEALLLQHEELIHETEHLEDLKEQLDNYWEQHTTQRGLLIAMIIILILAFIVIFSVIRAIWSHKRHRQMLAQQNAQLEKQKNELISLNDQLEKATQSKLVFFTNVSHDLRTPITLISEPIAQLSVASNLTEQQRSLIRIADKNVHILKRLINQILDFRKYENDKLDLNLTEIDLGKAVADWLSTFEAVAKKRHIQLTADIQEDNMVMAVDAEKIERVFFNLVSNAFKYSPDKATIHVVCATKQNRAIISVEDTGKGIAREDIKSVFDRFFQVDRVHPTGSGIGLSLSKAFVEMHDGTIAVESEEGKGSRFIVELPIKHIAKDAVDVEKNIGEHDVNAELDMVERPEADVDPSKPVLLIIDDNEDILNLVNQLLGDEYNVLAASNGKSGIRMATKYVPDVIICDVMMPIMNGLECTRNLRSEISTSHIPILMLTACSLDEQRVQGYESGADGYLSKPFNIDVLRARLRSLIENRRIISNLWKGNSTMHATTAIEPNRAEVALKKGISGIDDEFYHRFVDLVNKRMSDSSLNVESLAGELGLARSQFYRKIKALTNYSPVELLRSMRLKRARQMLTTTELSISEIGYEVGFSSAAYFSKCFHDEFGETPSQLRDRLGQGSNNTP